MTHNGQHLLRPLLESLQAQVYQNHEIVVVDNNSTDDTAEFVSRSFPHVRLIRLDKNLGFAGANNVGIRASDGELVALINNDTAADHRWLEFLVESALEDPRIAAVSSKILFFRPFLPVHLRVRTFRPADHVPASTDGRELGVLYGEDTAFEGCDYRKPLFKSGFHPPESLHNRVVRWTGSEATVYLPIATTETDALLQLVVSGGGVVPDRRLRVTIGSERVAEIELTSQLRPYTVSVSRRVAQSQGFDVINNAGTELTTGGETADRGIFDADRGQWDKAEDVTAFCGGAVLLRRSILEDVGLFDRSFFMYFEDTDLSWRLRSRGYRLRYEPRSTVRHLHAASSVDWSPRRFTYYVARNRILMIAKNGTPRAFLQAYLYELSCLVGILVQLVRTRRSSHHANIWKDLATRLRVHASFLVQIPLAVLKRLQLLPS